MFAILRAGRHEVYLPPNIALPMRYAFIWTIALLIGQFLSFFVTFAWAPYASLVERLGIGLFAGLLFGLIFTKTQRDQAAAFEAARLGDRAKCAAMLQKRRAANTSPDLFGTAALEIVAGEPVAAFARIQGADGTLGLALKLKTLVEAHHALVHADPGRHAQALTKLLDMGRIFHKQAERYRAYLMGLAALLPISPGYLVRVNQALATHGDPEARAYLQWGRAVHEVTPFDENDKLPDMYRAAELAKIQGLMRLAEKVSARAAAMEREGAARVGPYR